MNLKDNDSKTSNLELFVPYSKMPFCQVNLNWKPENSNQNAEKSQRTSEIFF